MNKHVKILYDVIVVGAGPAGLMTAIMCARSSLKVLLLDSQKQIGAKILMSGGTRCNVTNDDVSESFYNSEQIRRVRNILRGFNSKKAIEFFSSIGVTLKKDQYGKYYPSTNSAKTVLNAFLKEVKSLSIELKTGCRVNRVEHSNGIFCAKGSGFEFQSKTLVLCTGGLSFPKTGSDGMGLKISKTFGHHLIETMPALTPLRWVDKDWNSLMGVSVPCRQTLLVNGKKSVAFTHDLLFTHFGISGLGILNISRHWAKMRKKHKVELRANFFPQHNAETFQKVFESFIKKNPKAMIKKFLHKKFPQRFNQILFKK